MKNMRKLFALALALVMVLSLSVTAFAADPATSSITIKDSTTVKVDGRTFAAYRILDMQEIGDGYVYTVPAGMENFYAAKFSLDKTSADFDYEVTQKIAAMTSNSTELFDFAEVALAAAKAANLTEYTATGANGVATFANLPLGYYVVDDNTVVDPENPVYNVVSALILDSTTPAEVTIKADLPDIDKNIDAKNDTDPANDELEVVKFNNTSFGDVVPYVVTTNVPYMKDYKSYTFTVTDTMSKGLTFNTVDNAETTEYDEELTVKLDGTELVKDTDYTLTVSVNEETGKTTITVDFKNFIQYKDDPATEAVEGKEGKEIVITYSATVNTDAAVGIPGEPNKVTLTYSNDPDNVDSKGITPEHETRTYITEVELLKVNAADQALAGAEFTLTGERVNTVVVTVKEFVEATDGTYWALKAGTYTEVDPNAEGVDKAAYVVNTDGTYTKYASVENTAPQTKTESVTVTATTGPDGKIKFSGLGAGTYTITEIKAPNGYNLLETPITLTIGWTAPAEGKTDCTWTYTWAAAEAEGDDLIKSENNTSAQITVVNNAGTELPSTGGVGTTMFYVIGALLVLSSAVLLVTKKRMGAAE